MKMNVRVDGQQFDVIIEDLNTTPVVVMVDGQRIEVWPEMAATGAPTAKAGYNPEVEVAPQVSVVHAPIPGVIIGISVRPGEVVTYGQELCVLEAMKMKQSIRSAREGTIEQICVETGQHVGHHELLMTYLE